MMSVGNEPCKVGERKFGCLQTEFSFSDFIGQLPGQRESGAFELTRRKMQYELLDNCEMYVLLNGIVQNKHIHMRVFQSRRYLGAVF